MKLYWDKFKLENIIHKFMIIVLSIVIFMICTRHIRETTNMIVWDEIGYWGSAAFLAGYDWSSIVTANAGYYNYGYALILAPILKVFGGAGIAYQMAIIINGIMITSSFLMAYYIGCEYFGKENRQMVLIGAFVSNMFANTITQSCFAWSECLLIFLYWFILAMFTSLNKKFSHFKALVINILLIYMYFVHTRTIGVVIAGFCTLFICLVKQKDNKKKNKSILILVAIIVFVIANILKKYIKSNVWVNTDAALANSATVVFNDTVRKFNLEGIIEILKTLLMRFFYVGNVSYFLVFEAIYNLVVNLVKKIREKNFNIYNTYFFMILSMLGSFGVLALTLSYQGTYQALIYGRYVDNIIPPFIFFGIMFLFTENDKYLLFRLCIYEILNVLLYFISKTITINRDYFVANCNVDMYKYWIGTANGGYEFFRFMMISCLVCASIVALKYCKNKLKQRIYIPIIIMVLIFVKSKYDTSELVFYKTYTSCEGMGEIIDEIGQVCGNEEVVYFYRDDNWRVTPLEMWVQYKLCGTKVIDIDNIDGLGECYVIVPRQQTDDGYVASINIDGELLMEDKFIALYSLRGID
jgi:hypothetical protein